MAGAAKKSQAAADASSLGCAEPCARRTYRLFKYKACFIASEAIDWLVESGRAGSREHAVQLGRLLQASGYIHHVVDDHDFKDSFLFFRFFCGEWRRRLAGGAPGTRQAR
jgi:hypothetical protein